MQEIKAYIKVHKLEAVTLALHRVDGVTGMSVSDVRGFGRSKANTGAANPIGGADDLVRHFKVEVVCGNAVVDRVIDVFKHEARTGLRCDGRVFVSDVTRAVRIQDGLEDESVV